MASGRQVTYTLNLNSNVSGILGQAEKDALKLDSTMWQLQKTMSAFGIGLGATFLIDAAKQWTQGAADFETAMLRIKNASDNNLDGLKNQLFINKEVDTFKLKLEETVDAYSSFLFKIKNAKLGSDEKNNIFNELTAVGKVGGLSQSQMNATIYELGTLLGVGTLEARQLRMLGNVHPNIIPYIADVLGLKDNTKSLFLKGTQNQGEDDKTALQQIYQAMSTGKLTKSGISSLDVLPKALDLYYNDVKDKLPETLTTLQSEINNLTVTWDRFKNSFILENKGEIVDFFHELTGGIHWLVENKDEILHVASAVAEVTKMYIEWRIALLALQAPFAVVQFFTAEQQRLNATLDLYRTKNIEVSESNLQLAESQTVVAESQRIENDENEKFILLQDAKYEALAQQQLELDKLSESLTQVSIQTDLFTEAQILNGEISQKNVYDLSYNSSLLAESAEKAGFEWAKAGGAINITAREMSYELGIAGENSGYSFVIGAEKAMDAWITTSSFIIEKELEISESYAFATNLMSEITEKFAEDLIIVNSILDKESIAISQNLIQLSLFTNSELEMASSISSVSDSLIIENEQLEINNGLLAVHAEGVAAMAKANEDLALAGIVNGTTNQGIGLAGASLGLTGAFAGVSSLSSMITPVFITGMAAELLAGFIDKDSNGNGWNVKRILGANSDPLDQLLLGESVLKTLGFDLRKDYIDDKHSQEQKNYKGLLFETDLHNTEPWLFGGTFGINKDSKSTNTDKITSNWAKTISKDSNHLKGNSSNYFTVNIHEMNGIKTFEVTSTNGDLTTKRVAEIAGDTMLKMLSDVVNDSQIVKSK